MRLQIVHPGPTDPAIGMDLFKVSLADRKVDGRPDSCLGVIKLPGYPVDQAVDRVGIRSVR